MLTQKSEIYGYSYRFRGYIVKGTKTFLNDWEEGYIMSKILKCFSVFVAVIGLSCLDFETEALSASPSEKSLIEHGRYMSQIAGCNDCHTSDFLLSEGKVPEKLWLTGSRFGWRGPWGTTYAANLRLFVGSLTESQWVTLAKALRARPPMPWFDLNIMKKDDIRGLYHFMRYLGPSGGQAPAYVPPDKEPQPPYALFPSKPK
jgi:hypothetical protein